MAEGQTSQALADQWTDVPAAKTSAADTWTDVPPAGPSLWDRAKAQLSNTLETGKGVVKGGLTTGLHLSDLAQTVGNTALGGIPHMIASQFPDNQKAQAAWHDAAEKRLQPNNDFQKLGFQGEQLAEYAIPMGGEEKAVAGVAPLVERGIGALSKRMLRTAGTEGTKAAIVGSAQTGDVGQGLEQGAGTAVLAPGISELSRVISPVLKKSAEHLMDRFLIPGGGAAYNKSLVADSSGQLIKDGEMWMSKGSAIRDVEQRLMDSTEAIETAENNILNSMGYAPTGRSTLRVRAEPYSVPGGPTIDVDDLTAKPGVVPTSQDLAIRGTPPPASSGMEVGPPQTAVGERLPPADPNVGPTRTGTRLKIDRVDETKQGMLYVGDAVKQLRAMMGQHIVEGQVIEGHGPALAARGRLLKQITDKMTPSGYMNADSAIKLRRGFDAMVDHQKNPQIAQYKPGVEAAFKETADTLRHEIAEQVPGMKEANQQYHFWSGINKVLKDKENQRIGHRTGGLIGALAASGGFAAGMQHGGYEQAAGAAMLAGVAGSLINSGANLTGSAVALDRVGKLMQSGDYKAAVNWLARATPKYAVQGDTPQVTPPVQ
jgi:hypothetical protein